MFGNAILHYLVRCWWQKCWAKQMPLYEDLNTLSHTSRLWSLCRPNDLLPPIENFVAIGLVLIWKPYVWYHISRVRFSFTRKYCNVHEMLVCLFACYVCYVCVVTLKGVLSIYMFDWWWSIMLDVDLEWIYAFDVSCHHHKLNPARINHFLKGEDRGYWIPPFELIKHY